MSSYKLDHEGFAREILKAFTDFHKSDDNYQVCVDFVVSNFKHHRFLDVDKHKVKRSLDGIWDKFKIHAQDVKADEFKSLLDDYINSPVHKDQDFGATDTPYCVLSTLLLLAEEPTGADYKKREKTPEEVEEDNFDWKEYLLDGEEPIPSFADYSDSDGECEWGTLKDGNKQGRDESERDTVALESAVLKVKTEDDEDSEAKSELMKHIVRPYWDDRVDSSVSMGSLDITLSLVTEIKAYLSDSSCDQELNTKHIVSEYQLNREFLWILSGVKDSFIFQWDGQQFIPNVKVQFLHLSHHALRRCLLMLCHYGTAVQKLQGFFEKVAFEQELPLVSRKPCQTDQAFASAICEYLQAFKQELVVLERKVSNQDDTITVQNLLDQLSVRLDELELLRHIYDEGIEAYIYCRNNSIRASHLLGVIYNTMLECNTLSDDKQNQVCLLLSLWIKSVKPYLEMIDHWIANGTLEDPFKEFIVERNENVKTRDENYWSDSLILHVPRSGDRDCPDLNETTSEYSAPSFILPVIKEIVVAGKSTEVLRELGKLQEISDMDGGDNSLHHQMNLAIRGFLCDLSETDAARSMWTDSPSEREAIIGQLHSSITSVRGIQDPLLRFNFSRLVALARELPEKEEKPAFNPSDISTESFPPMQLLLQKCLYPNIHAKYKQVCTKLLSLMRSEHDLHGHLSCMRQYYLMESGAAMYDFYTEIFERARLGESWRDVSLLNTLISDAVGKGYREGLEVRLDDTTEAPRHGLGSMEGVTPHYEVPWPVNNVIHSRTEAVYNQVFSFLLQVKWVKYSLDELRFSTLEAHNTPEIVHKMQIFRMKLMHFVNSLHNYLMTRILHSTGLEFTQELEAATDLDEIICVHNSFVTKIHERCLLHKSISFIKEVVGKVLNLAIFFRGRWEATSGTITTKGLGSLESEFTRCIQFLSSFINNALKKHGSFPHLESLAFALITSGS